MTIWWLAILMHTWTWCTPVMHTCLQQIKVHPPFCEFFGVTTSTRNTGWFQTQAAADLMRSRNDAMLEMSAFKVSKRFPLRRRVCGPSAEERLWHEVMARREASSAREYVTRSQPSRLSLFTKSGPIIAQENHARAGFPQPTDRKGQSSYGDVKMSLIIQAALAGDGGTTCPGERNGPELGRTAVVSTDRTGKSEEKTDDEDPPS